MITNCIYMDGDEGGPIPRRQMGRLFGFVVKDGETFAILQKGSGGALFERPINTVEPQR